MSPRSLAAAVLLVGWIAAGTAGAVEPVNADRAGVALHGYDPVSYFEDGAPAEGSPEIVHEWNGAVWRFASEAHRLAFAESPEQYAPQYGGYCAKAVSDGDTADIDPEAWDIVAGKLYLNYSKKIQKVWRADRDARIRRADAHWPRLRDD